MVPRLSRAIPSLPALLRTSRQSSTLARITILGRLGATPESSVTSTGREITKYVVGTTTGQGENQKSNWFRVSSFSEGSRKEFLERLEKGTLIYVEGSVGMHTFEDADGKKRTSMQITQQTLDVIAKPRFKQDSEDVQ